CLHTFEDARSEDPLVAGIAKNRRAIFDRIGKLFCRVMTMGDVKTTRYLDKIVFHLVSDKMYYAVFASECSQELYVAFMFLLDVSNFAQGLLTKQFSPSFGTGLSHVELNSTHGPLSGNANRHLSWLLGGHLLMKSTASVVILALFQTLVLAVTPSERRIKPRSPHSESLMSRIPNPISVPLVNHSQLNIRQGLNTTAHDDPTSLCQSLPLIASLWRKLGMNFYLDNYPNGTHLSLEARILISYSSLQEYASQTGGLDFQCGIGRTCNPGQVTAIFQLCENVYGRNWYALVAAQNWNNFVNMLYQATGDA
ncbi:hypothetical protein VP01_1951g1, partial [Puccinia sorghi]